MVCVLVFATAAQAHPNQSHQLCDRYNAAYGRVADKMGQRTPGRNICQDGWSDRRGATILEKQKGLEHLHTMLAPPASTSQPTAAPVGSGACAGITPYPGAGECWAVPYSIVACESGGSLTAQNGSSGAYGAYQLLGHGEYAGMSKAEQDQMAAELWAGGDGAGNWVCAG